MLIGELWLPVLNGTFLLALGFTRFWPATRERFAAIVIGWTAIEIGVVVHLLNPAQFEPRSPTPAESPVLSRLARSSPDRVAGTVGNLPLLAGVASSGQPARPAVSRFNAPGLTYLGESWPTIPEPARFGDHAYLLGYSGQTIEDDHVEFMRLSGIRMLVLGSSMSSVAFDERLQKADTISDERLTQMRFGPSLLQAGPIASRWQILELKPEVTCSRAWLFPVSDPPDAGTDPRLLMRPPPTRRRMLEKAVPVDRIDDHGEQVTIEGDCPSQSVLVLSDLHYPGWTATLDQEGESNDVPIQAAFGDWRAVHIPRGGRFELTFRYEPRSIRVGATISIGAVLLWLIGFGMAIFVERSRGTAVD